MRIDLISLATIMVVVAVYLICLAIDTDRRKAQAEKAKTYRRLKKGELIQEGDECDFCADAWMDWPRWVPANPEEYGRPAPDPQMPSHRLYRRPI